MRFVNISEFVGRTFSAINVESDEIRFILPDGTHYLMHHRQNCCENVEIEDVCGDIGDLIGTEILLAEESTSKEPDGEYYSESFTFSFYKLATIKGAVTIRWLGESNGYYSEAVDLEYYDRGEHEYYDRGEQS